MAEAITPPARTVGDVLAERASAGMVGRREELAEALRILDEDGPRVLCVHGPAGLGKSTLVAAAGEAARRRGATVVHLDCRDLEPTTRGLLTALSRAAAVEVAGLDEVASGLGALGPVVVLALDTYELFRLSDAWLRRVLVPSLPENVRLVIAGREPPTSEWWSSPGWERTFAGLRLGPLPDEDALELLERAGLSRHEATRLNDVARGHPLALRIGAAAAGERPNADLGAVAVARVLEGLVGLYLAEIAPGTRRLVEAASVVRRVTRSLLAAMLGEACPADAYTLLARLPFVEPVGDGLMLHESVQEAVSAWLREADPSAHRAYRRAAWRRLRAEVADADRTELWRYTADLLYLLENPAVREAFFPTSEYHYAVEPASAADGDAILDIAVRHEPPGAVAILEWWWRRAPGCFRVVRDRRAAVVGFSLLLDLSWLDQRALDVDPVMAAWLRHLREEPVPPGQRVLLHRRRLGRDAGEGPSAVQAASWLDIKRRYMELRPTLRRLYTVHRDPAPFMPVLTTLEYQLLPGSVEIDGAVYHALCLDFGPGSVDGWLARLAAAELGVADPDLLDAEAHELVLDGARVRLAPREFALLEYLMRREGRVVNRVSLLEDVWGEQYRGASNVVEVAVRSLRRKLGPRGAWLETVRGVGYRWRRG